MQKCRRKESPGYSLTKIGKKISDEQIKEWLNELICCDGFPYGYNKLTICLKEEYNLLINRKKVYRLCKGLNILKPQRTIQGMILPKIRTDNGPQFTSNLFEETVKELGVIHERIPIKTPNMNAHIESFHSIFEDECYSQNEFESFMNAYSVVTDYMKYYNERKRHGSIKFMPPHKFYAAFIDDKVKVKPFTA
ncbi:Integrase catalytic region [Tepidanaerobacter acetatoxydans Re1]|uniref:Integrase catalytic region n=1 Tax=Tepidanaerobacter acetatoxydans (strain DSM 21804 / JCM 16047 / Re1) TaxID=1209989 RepID=F4LXJ1_TEPAE|nr:Integrase catalytic region [Tepidanaerobacter acetatoxydans Re1]CCP25730.1 Integrase catalytic region [Tepidanaerobacter acetatoxydans Re1]